MIRLIATDLDGTLLSGHETISDENLRAIRKALSNGIVFVAASGRSADSCGRLLRRYEMDGPIIAVNGGHVVSRRNGDTLSLHPMSRALAAECMRIFETHALHACLYTTEWIVYSSLEALCYYEEFLTPEGKTKRRYAEGVRHGRDAIADALNGTPLKAFCAFLPGQEAAFQAARDACAKLPGACLTSSWPDNFEVMPEGVNKAKALAELAARLDILRDEVMAFGDSDNDIEMLQWAGIGVAMENAREEVKRAADYVTKACYDDGVAHAMKLFL